MIINFIKLEKNIIPNIIEEHIIKNFLYLHFRKIIIFKPIGIRNKIINIRHFSKISLL